jgi:CPA2 family monovalent cation:H+ antiporter-2
MQCSFSLTQIGEFAFILASMGTSLGVTSDFLYPIVVAVSVFTTFTTPYMIRLASPVYGFVERRLPSSWRAKLENYATDEPEPETEVEQHRLRDYLKQTAITVFIYSVLCMAIIGLVLYFAEPFIARMLSHPWDAVVVAALSVLLIAPFLRSLMLKGNRSETFLALWNGDRFYRAPLVAVQVLRFLMGAAFVSYILGRTVHWIGMLGILVVIFVVFNILFSHGLQKQGDMLEKTFNDNLNQREQKE